MLGDGVDVDRRIGRAADRRIGDDGVLERLAGENVGRLQILAHDLDRAHAGLIGDLPALAIRRRNGGAARQRHAERLGKAVHGRSRAHRVAVPDRGRRIGDEVDEFLVADLAGGVVLARLPHHHAGADAALAVPAVEHRAAGQNDRRDVHRRRRHDAGRRGLVAAGHQHDAVERIAVQDLDQAEISEIAVERGVWALAGLLDRVHRKFEGDAAGGADAGAHALGELDMVTVTGRQVGAGLRDADDRLAGGQLFLGQAPVEVALEIERRHARVLGIVEPELRAELLVFRFCGLVGHERHLPGRRYDQKNSAAQRRGTTARLGYLCCEIGIRRWIGTASSWAAARRA